ncbi:MAG: HK97 gp10 family phage protein [Acidimicrobiia bacterium]
MATASDAIRIQGLRDLQRALKAADGESQKQLRVAMNQAAEIVVVEARRRGPVRSGRLRDTIRAQSGQREARVVAGSKRVPYAAAVEWSRRGGRFLFPAYRSRKPQIAQALEEAIVAVARHAGFDVKGG